MNLFKFKKFQKRQDEILEERIEDICEKRVIVTEESEKVGSFESSLPFLNFEYIVVKADGGVVGLMSFPLFKDILARMTEKEKHQVTFLDCLFDFGSFDVYPNHGRRRVYATVHWYQGFMKGNIVVIKDSRVIGVVPEKRMIQLVYHYQTLRRGPIGNTGRNTV